MSFGQPKMSSLHEMGHAVTLQPDPLEQVAQQATHEQGIDTRHLKGGFLEAAGIHTFSVCFNDGDQPGVLRFGTQPSAASDTMTSMGKMHWGVGLMGISVGSQAAAKAPSGLAQTGNLLVCDPNASPPPLSQQKRVVQEIASGMLSGPNMPGTPFDRASAEETEPQRSSPAIRSGDGLDLQIPGSTAQEPTFPHSSPLDQEIPRLGGGLFEEARSPPEGSNTPCGAIPDTGSTAIMAPRAHIAVLFEGVCNAWQRCVEFSARLTSLARQSTNIWTNARDMPMDSFIPSLSALLVRVEEEHNVEWSRQRGQDIKVEEQRSVELGLSKEVLTTLKASSFISLLDRCATWMGAETGEGKGLDELPQINFLLKGENAEPKNYPIHGAAYVNVVMAPEVERVRANLHGVVPLEVLNRTGHKKKVCTPAFGAMHMQSHTNGPLWILGQPLFYQYNVNFDRNARTIALTDRSTCGQCQNHPPSQTLSLAEKARQMQRRPRVIRGTPRLPNIARRHGVVEF
jgi:hypothetical protein